MSTYIPYTPGIDEVDLVPDAGRYVPAEVAQLERARESLLARRETGTYTPEIQNAVTKVEEALNFLLHFRERRAKEGILTIDFPEIDTGKQEWLYNLGLTDVSVDFVKDTLNGQKTVQQCWFNSVPPKYIMGLLSALQAARCMKEYSHSKNMHHLIEIVENDEKEITPHTQVKITVLIDDDTPADFSFDPENAGPIHEVNLSNYATHLNTLGSKAVSISESNNGDVLRFVCLSTNKIREYTFSEEFKALNITDTTFLFSAIGDYVREVTGVLPFGNGGYPYCIFHILDMDDNAFDTVVGKINELVNRFVERNKMLDHIPSLPRADKKVEEQ